MSKHSRRDFLRTAMQGAAIAGTGLAAFKPLVSLAAEPQTVAAPRSYDAARFALELNGLFAGWVESVSGGTAVSGTAVETEMPLQIRGGVGAVHYEDVTLNCGTGMSRSFYDWIRAGLVERAVLKSGAIVICDFNGKEISRMNLFNAALVEVVFPACDAASKANAAMTVRLSPQQVQQVMANRSPYGSAGNARLAPRWSTANFRLQIPGIDCSGVSDVGAIAKTTGYNSSQLAAIATPLSAKSQRTNLSVTVSERSAPGFFQWYQDFVVKGNNGPAALRSGAITYLTPNLADSLFVVSFSQLGILSFKSQPSAVGASTVPQFLVEMYCQNIGFECGAAAVA